MVTTNRSTAVVLMALTAPACFDVATVDPGVVLVDDFDDGDFVPAMPELGYWQCYTYNTATNGDYRCDHDAGYLSAYGLFVEFTLNDVPDKNLGYPGVGFLSYGESGARFDLTPYRELVISMKLENGEPAIPSPRVYVELQCRTAKSETGERPILDYFYVTLGDDGPPADWMPKTFPLANFGPPGAESQHIKGGTPACLRAVDGIAIVLKGVLNDGQSGRGKFFIDDLRFQ